MKSFIEDFAAQLGIWLKDVVPGIEGRTFAVSEVDPFTNDNMPTLPLGFVGIVGQRYTDFPNGVTTFVAEIVLAPVRAVEGCDTPFWAYYDVDAVRDAIFGNLEEVEDRWGRILPTEVEVEADKLAVHIQFTFTRAFVWRACPPVESCGPKLLDQGVRVVLGGPGAIDPCARRREDCRCVTPERCTCALDAKEKEFHDD